MQNHVFYEKGINEHTKGPSSVFRHRRHRPSVVRRPFRRRPSSQRVLFSKKGNPTITTSTITARIKGDPQHMWNEKI